MRSPTSLWIRKPGPAGVVLEVFGVDVEVRVELDVGARGRDRDPAGKVTRDDAVNVTADHALDLLVARDDPRQPVGVPVVEADRVRGSDADREGRVVQGDDGRLLRRRLSCSSSQSRRPPSRLPASEPGSWLSGQSDGSARCRRRTAHTHEHGRPRNASLALHDRRDCQPGRGPEPPAARALTRDGS